MLTKIITVNQSDCVFVSGTFYRLPSETVFRFQVNAIMDDEECMPFLHPINHNTTVTFAGTTFSRTIEIINNYQVQFLPNTAWTVEITESNNNLHDVGSGVLVQNQVQVIPTNTGGLVVTSSGASQQSLMNYS